MNDITRELLQYREEWHRTCWHCGEENPELSETVNIDGMCGEVDVCEKCCLSR